MSSSTWTWDASRGAYYYFSVAESAFVYQNGEPISWTSDASQERTTSPHGSLAQSAYTQVRSTAESEKRESFPAYEYGHQPFGAPDSSQEDMAALQESFAETRYSQVGYAAELEKNYNVSEYGKLAEAGIDLIAARPNHSSPPLPRHSADNIEAINSNPSDAQRDAESAIALRLRDFKVDQDRYRVRNKASKFFKVGKVFRVLWPGVAGENSQVMSAATSWKNQRRFVVIREKGHFSPCLPINTYNGKGCKKNLKDITSSQHAIVYITNGKDSLDLGGKCIATDKEIDAEVTEHGKDRLSGRGFWQDMNLDNQAKGCLRKSTEEVGWSGIMSKSWKPREDQILRRFGENNPITSYRPKAIAPSIFTLVCAMGSAIVLRNYPRQKGKLQPAYHFTIPAVLDGIPSAFELSRVFTQPKSWEVIVAGFIYATAIIAHGCIHEGEAYRPYFLLAGAGIAVITGVTFGQCALLDVLPWSIVCSMACSTTFEWMLVGRSANSARAYEPGAASRFVEKEGLDEKCPGDLQV